MDTLAIQRKEAHKAEQIGTHGSTDLQRQETPEIGAESGLPLFLRVRGGSCCGASSPPPDAAGLSLIQRKTVSPEEEEESELEEAPAEPEREEELLQLKLTGTQPNLMQRQVKEEEENELAETPAEPEQEEELLQPKLAIGQPGDAYEREADQVADVVMGKVEPSPEGQKLTSSPTEKPRVQRKCAVCEAAEKEQPDKQAETTVQRKASGKNGPVASRFFPQHIQPADAGISLSSRIREKVEPVLGVDLSDVRVHSRPGDRRLAHSLGAKAFTHKHDIWTGENQSPDDLELMAHEAAHVVQQSAAPTPKIQLKNGDGEERTSSMLALERRLRADDERGALGLIEQLSSAEVNQVLRSTHYRGLAVRAFWDTEMLEAVLAMMRKNGDLYHGLKWVLIEGTNWEGVRQVIQAARRGHDRILRDAWLRDQFVQVCDNETMAQAVDLLRGTLIQKLTWMQAEGSYWSLVAPKLTAAPENERLTLYPNRSMRDFFVTICTDATMFVAVHHIGGSLLQKLLWMKAEGSTWLLVKWTMQEHPQSERAGLYRHEDIRDFLVSVCSDLDMQEAVNLMGGRLSDQMDWLRAEGADLAPLLAQQRAPEVTDEDAALLNRLEGTHHLFRTVKSYDTAIANRDLAESLSSSAIRRDPGFDVMGFHDNQVERTRTAMEGELSANGFRSREDFMERVREFENFFQGYALQTGFEMLRENERVVNSEKQRYQSAQDGQAIYDALQPARDKLTEMRAVSQRLEAHRREHYESGTCYPWACTTGRYRTEAAGQQAQQMSEEYRRLRGEADAIIQGLASTYPVLADPDLTRGYRLIRLLDADRAGMIQMFRSTADARLADIHRTRGSLAEDTSKIWQLQPVLQRARLQLRITQGSVYDLIIRDRTGDIQRDQTFVNIALAALAIGLGLVSMGTGTVAVLAAAGSFALSAYMAAEHTQEYLEERSAARSAFDRAQAISSNEPSLFWLALDIVGAVLDLGGAFKAFRALSAGARAAASAGDVATAAARMEDLATAARRIAPEAGALNADEFAEAIVASVERQRRRSETIARSSAAAREVIEQALPDVDDVTKAALLRLGEPTANALIAGLRNSPDAIIRAAQLAEQAPTAMEGMRRMRGALGDDFAGVLGDLLRRRDITRATETLDAFGSGRLTREQVQRLSQSTAEAQTAGDKVRAFQSRMDEILGRAQPPGSGSATRAAGESAAPDWARHLNEETQTALRQNPDLQRLFETMDPRVRRLLTRCASTCIPTDPPPTPSQIQSLRRLLDDLGVEDTHPGLRDFFHANAGALDDAIRHMEEVVPQIQAAGIRGELRDAVLSSPRARHLLISDEYPLGSVQQLWDSFRSPSATHTRESFDDYLRYHRGYRTGSIRTPRENPTLEAKFSNWSSLSGNRARNLAILSDGEDKLAAALRNGTLPDHLLNPLSALLDTDIVRSSRMFRPVRQRMMHRINEILGERIQNMSEFRTTMDLVNNAANRGSIGEHFVRRNYLGPRSRSLERPAFEVPGATRNPVFPDHLRPQTARTMDVKVGYENTRIDVDQLDNYVKLQRRSQVPNSPLAQQLAGEPFNMPRGIIGHDYMFLPSGTAGSARQAALDAWRMIRNKGYQNYVRVFYVDNLGNVRRVGRYGRLTFPQSRPLPD